MLDQLSRQTTRAQLMVSQQKMFAAMRAKWRPMRHLSAMRQLAGRERPGHGAATLAYSYIRKRPGA